LFALIAAGGNPLTMLSTSVGMVVVARSRGLEWRSRGGGLVVVSRAFKRHLWRLMGCFVWKN
jgi:hypothetical protein